MNQYYTKVLGEILQGEQPTMKAIIDIHFEEGCEVEGTIVYSFESLRISEAVEWLEDNWEYISNLYA